MTSRRAPRRTAWARYLSSCPAQRPEVCSAERSAIRSAEARPDALRCRELHLGDWVWLACDYSTVKVRGTFTYRVRALSRLRRPATRRSKRSELRAVTPRASRPDLRPGR